MNPIDAILKKGCEAAGGLKPRAESLAADRLTQAVTGLLLDSPFFGAVIMRVERRPVWRIPTASIDGKTLRYNPFFVIGLDSDVLVTLIAHESMHVALGHPWRIQPGMDFPLANQAADHAINLVLSDSFQPIPAWLCDSRFADMSFEQIYGILAAENPPPDDNDSGDGGGDGGGGGDDSGDDKSGGDGGGGGGDGGDSEDSEPPQITGTFEPAPDDCPEGDAMDTTQQDAMVAYARGNMPEKIAKILGIEQANVDSLDWLEVLPRFLQGAGIVNGQTWSRPNRRFIGSGMYMPSNTKDGNGVLVFAVDTSGSVSGQNVRNSLEHLNNMLESCSPELVHVVFWGSGVVHVDTYQAGEPVDVDAIHYGGGTNFYSVLTWLEDSLPEPPTALVVLTDGYFPRPSEESEPLCPVCFVITPDSQLKHESFKDWPFGQFTFQTWKDGV